MRSDFSLKEGGQALSSNDDSFVNIFPPVGVEKTKTKKRHGTPVRQTLLPPTKYQYNISIIVNEIKYFPRGFLKLTVFHKELLRP